MAKRWIAWLMSMVCVLSLCACLPLKADAAVNAVNAYLYTNKNCSMPQTGTAKTPVFLVQFPDHKNTAPSLTAEKVEKKFFDAGSPNSITGFYKTSSFGNLTIKGDVYGWYTAKQKRSNYHGVDGNAALYQEVLRYYDTRGLDFSAYDGDKDGIVDCVYLLFAGEDTGFGSDWWSSSGYLPDASFRLDGKGFGSYVKLSSDDLATAVHETGHALGLWDYYEVNEKTGTSYGIGGHDMMDDNTGDHNALSKIMLGWITPTVVLGSDIHKVVTIPIESQAKGECIVYFTGNKVDYTAEYYVIEYMTGAGYYQKNEAVGTGGFRVLHVNGIDSFGKPKVSLVEADGDGSVAGLTKWEHSDLFSGGAAYEAKINDQITDYILFLDQISEKHLGMVCFMADEQDVTVTEQLICDTEALLLKRKTAFSPIVTDAKGVSVNETLDWVSVNPKVASVSQKGKITAKAAGSTAIIGSKENKNGSVDVVIIEVTVVSSLNKVTFAPRNDSLTPGARTTMSIKVGEEDLTDRLNISWSRSNKRISVSRFGTVKANKVGLSTVKATLEGGIILTCQFTVDFKPIKAKVQKTSAGHAELCWNPISGASGYSIYRYNYKTKADPVLIATVRADAECCYIDKKVKKGTNYAYQVFAFDDTQSQTVYSQGSAWANFKAK